jgi:16S rRNA G1207 methylase RsmC
VLPPGVVNKQITFAYHGSELLLNLSQSLFSSFAVDAGSRLLLKTIAQQTNPEKWSTLLDVGCGTGVLGLAIKKRHPHIRSLLIDRDALALEVARENSRINGLAGIEFSGSLGLAGRPPGGWDLIISNLPAKAGEPVLVSMMNSFASCLSERGSAAVVIVRNLEGLALRALTNSEAHVVYRETSGSHTVFHYRGKGRGEAGMLSSGSRGESKENPAYGSLQALREVLRPYIRAKAAFHYEKTSYLLNVVYNVSDFDTLGYQARLVIDLVSSVRLAGTGLFWNPGQGHLPLYALLTNRLEAIILAGRDLLALAVSRLNLIEEGGRKIPIRIIHTPFFSGLEAKADFLVLLADTSMVGAGDLLRAGHRLLVKGGWLAIGAKSSGLSRLVRGREGFAVEADRRYRGFRALLMRRK